MKLHMKIKEKTISKNVQANEDVRAGAPLLLYMFYDSLESNMRFVLIGSRRS